MTLVKATRIKFNDGELNLQQGRDNSIELDHMAHRLKEFW